jgi:hypothetical protein
MNRTLKNLAFSCATGLLLAGAAIGSADAHGGGGGHFGGGGHIGGGPGFGGGHIGHYGGGHFGHGFHHGRFFAGIGDGLNFDDYAGPYYGYYDASGCSYARNMWRRTGRPYWLHRYEACLSG